MLVYRNSATQLFHTRRCCSSISGVSLRVSHIFTLRCINVKPQDKMLIMDPFLLEQRRENVEKWEAEHFIHSSAPFRVRDWRNWKCEWLLALQRAKVSGSFQEMGDFDLWLKGNTRVASAPFSPSTGVLITTTDATVTRSPQVRLESLVKH